MFARVCNHVADFNVQNKCLTAKLLQQDHRYHILRKTFSTLYRRHYDLISKFNFGLRALLRDGLSGPEFLSSGDLVYKFRGLIEMNDFSLLFRKIIARCRRVGCGSSVMRQSACLVFNLIMVVGFDCVAFFGCAPVGRASDSLMAPSWYCSFWLVGAGASCLLLGPPGYGCFLLLLFFDWFRGFDGLFGAQGSPSSDSLLTLLSPLF